MEGAHLADLGAPSDKLSEEGHALALLAWSPAPVASLSLRYATQALAKHTCMFVEPRALRNLNHSKRVSVQCHRLT